MGVGTVNACSVLKSFPQLVKSHYTMLFVCGFHTKAHSVIYFSLL